MMARKKLLIAVIAGLVLLDVIPVLATTLASNDAGIYGVAVPSHLQGQSVTLLPDGTWLLVGGLDEGKPTGRSLIEDLAKNKLTLLQESLNIPRAWHTATLLPDGRVLIFGGIGVDGKVVNQAEYFDPSTRSFSLASLTGLTPRSHHTANVLSDGLVLFAGGAEFAASQLWDPRTNSVTAVTNSMVLPRQDAISSLLATSPVLIWGGTDTRGLPVSGAEFFLPSQDAFLSAQTDSVLLPPTPDATLLPSVSGTLPVDGAKNVSVSVILSVRFNEHLNVATLNDSTVTLIGPTGLLGAKVVPVEQGMLLFVTPVEELLPASNYTLFIRGALDAQGRPLPLSSLNFKTASLSGGVTATGAVNSNAAGTISVVESPLPPSVGIWQPPSGAYKDNWVMGPAVKTSQANVPMLQAPQGITALSGQVLLQNGAPLPGVVVSVGNMQTLTDSAGRFLLQKLPAGHVQFIVNGRTANTSSVQFGQFVIGADIQPNVTTVLSYTIWMPVIDTAHAVSIPSPTTQEVDITSPLLPGVILKIPAGTVIREPNGNIVTQVSLTPVPVDRSPIPMPTPTSLYFVIQPGGAMLESVDGGPSQGATLVYPNVHHQPAASS
ncbi:MAG: Ig-like domain-containing protein, partial [Gammaproteobacteria bacterium]|nr:Ig-like domain-containing protein [Gammaproteobacteria bacterium]